MACNFKNHGTFEGAISVLSEVRDQKNGSVLQIEKNSLSWRQTWSSDFVYYNSFDAKLLAYYKFRFSL